MTAAAVDVAAVRRWVRRTQASHRDRGEFWGNIYFAVFFAVVAVGMVFDRVRWLIWPVDPSASALAGASLAVLIATLLYQALRRLGPLALSRPATSFLMTAPVSRRALLAPSLRLATLGAAAAGALGTVVVVGHSVPRPVPGAEELLLPLTGALAGAVVLLVALAAQAGHRWGRVPDGVASLLLAAGVTGMVADAASGAPRATGVWSTRLLVTLVVVLAVVAVAGYVTALARIGGTPNDRIVEGSRTVGTLADAVYGVQPSFVGDMAERRHWAHRRLRSTRPSSRLPALIAQDLLLVRRRPGRLLWLAGGTAVPVLFIHGPAWLLALAVLAGGFLAAGTSAATVRTDAQNPMMLRMLGLSSRQAIVQRLVVPAVLGGLWATLAFLVLGFTGVLPGGPWWLLGPALAPMLAVAAVRRGRVGMVDNGLLPLDTPMGSVATGPVLGAVIGYDALLFGLPTLVLIVLGDPLTVTSVLVQAAASAFLVRIYLTLTTATDRVELAERI